MTYECNSRPNTLAVVSVPKHFRKDWSTGKSKLVVFLEVLPQVLLCFTELGTVALIEDEYNLLLINRQITLAFHEVVQLLNGSDDNLVIIFIDVSLQPAVLSEPLTLSGEKLWYSFIVW